MVCDLQVPGFKDFQVSLLEKVWIGDLQVHQQVAARAVDVTTVTLKQQNYSYFQAQISYLHYFYEYVGRRYAKIHFSLARLHLCSIHAL